MHFRIADSFTASLARLTNDEQKAAKTTAFDLQLNPANPGLSFHRLDTARDKRFWSVRVSSDIRLIVHKTDASLLLCYVGHHDDAYAWAERRKLETHPTTGAAQFVEVRERVVETVTVAQSSSKVKLTPTAQKDLPFAAMADEVLLLFGIPRDWLAALRVATEDDALEIAGHLPAEAAEAVLTIATGGTPLAAPVRRDADPFDHPDAQRRFRVLNDRDALEAALAFPWEKWTVFLHPAQRELVEREYSGPARVAGTAGTGKTIVAVHRAAHLARTHEDSRILLTTFNDTLAGDLHLRLRRLISNTPRVAERITVESLDALASRLYRMIFGQPLIADEDDVRKVARRAMQQQPSKFSLGFVLSEWHEVVDAWQIQSWEHYRDFKRLGRKTRLPEAQRESLWAVLDRKSVV